MAYERFRSRAMGAALLMLVGALFLFWLGLARPEPEEIARGSFDQRGPAFLGAPPAERVAPRSAASVGFVRRNIEAAPGGVAAAPPPAPEPAPDRRPAVAAPNDAEDEENQQAPGGEEGSALLKVVGAFGNADAEKMGSTPGMSYKIAGALLGYPRALKYVLDNKYFIRGVMSIPKVKQNCAQKSSLAAALTDMNDPLGVRATLDVLDAAKGKPGAVGAILGSKFTQEFVNNCPSVREFSKDENAVRSAASRNPRLLQVALDPQTALGFAGNSQAGELYVGLQTTLMTGGAKR